MLQDIENIITVVAYFLRDLLPILNQHNCDFLTDDLWNQFLPAQIKLDLLQLSIDQLHKLPMSSSKLYSNCATEHHKSECGSDITTENNTISHAIDSLSDNMDSESLRLCHSSDNSKPEWDKSLKPVWRYDNLQSFRNAANNHVLSQLNVVSSPEVVLRELSQSAITNAGCVHVSHNMGEKKSHEIRIMSDMCARLAEIYDIHHVVDIGSGKGYLGCELSLQHRLKVLGIDSSVNNTESAAIRTEKLKKLWPGLVRQSVAKQELSESGGTGEKTSRRKRRLARKQATKNHSSSGDATIGHELASSSNTSCGDVVNELYVPITEFVSDKTNLGLLVQSHFLMPGADSAECQCKIPQSHDKHNAHGEPLKECEVCLSNITTTFQHSVAINTRDCLLCDNSQVAESRDAQSDSLPIISLRQKCQDILLTGLHTCGDLAGTILRQFSSNPDCKVTCHVGCCYHLISERFLSTPGLGPEASEVSFPLSSVLKSREFQLGRNARMLACQSAERMSKEPNPESDKSLLWRAILQVILRDVTAKNDCDNWRIGRIASKCQTFTEYVHKAFTKLQIDHKLTDDEIKQYEDRYEIQQHKMSAFFYLKAVLAPCIEALILLDRLCYILEQSNTAKAFLVPLFDPVTSPRCYAIIAVKTSLLSEDSTTKGAL